MTTAHRACLTDERRESFRLRCRLVVVLWLGKRYRHRPCRKRNLPIFASGVGTGCLPIPWPAPIPAPGCTRGIQSAKVNGLEPPAPTCVGRSPSRPAASRSATSKRYCPPDPHPSSSPELHPAPSSFTARPRTPFTARLSRDGPPTRDRGGDRACDIDREATELRIAALRRRRVRPPPEARLAGVSR